MNDQTTLDPYGALTEPATLTIKRLLPGPVERVWAYLTDSDLRRQWLASGEMKLVAGAPFELVWRNSELTDPPGKTPAGLSEEHRMQSRIVAIDPPRKLVMTWGTGGEVSFEIQPRGGEALLTVIHRRLPDRDTMLKVAAGWHTHLDILVARATGAKPEAFWDGWTRVRKEYERLLPA